MNINRRLSLDRARPFRGKWYPRITARITPAVRGHAFRGASGIHQTRHQRHFKYKPSGNSVRIGWSGPAPEMRQI